MLNALAAGALAASLVFPGGAAATEDTPSGKVVIDVVTVNGTGCAKGTAAVAMSPDNTAFTVSYSNYIAQAGGSSASTDMRKNCQLSVLVHVPSGFTYAVASADYRGFASLAKGASAVERANYYYQGFSTTTYVSHTINGPKSDDWQTHDEIDIPSLSWYPCGEQRNLNINTELRVNKGSSTGTSWIQMDSTDLSLATIYHLAWKRCTK